MKPINLNLPEPMLKQLAALKKKTGLSVAEMIRRAISDWLEKQK